MRKINVFDWDKKFPEIFLNDGFDIVIGNPPYLRIQGLKEYFNDQIDFLINRYKSAIKRFDIYMLFLEKGFILLKPKGKLGFICPHKFINTDSGSGIREYLINNKAINKLISFGHNLIFQDASTYTGLIFLSKKNNNIFRYYEFSNIEKNIPTLLGSLDVNDYATYDINKFLSSAWTLSSKEIKGVLDKIFSQKESINTSFQMVLQGVVTGMDDIYFLKISTNTTDTKNIIELYSEYEKQNIKIEKGLLKPMLKGDDIKKYSPPIFSHYCIYPYKLVDNKTVILKEKELAKMYPLGYSYLKKYKMLLRDLRIKFKTNPEYWYSCHRSRDMNVFESREF